MSPMPAGDVRNDVGVVGAVGLDESSDLKKLPPADAAVFQLIFQPLEPPPVEVALVLPPPWLLRVVAVVPQGPVQSVVVELARQASHALA